MNLEFLEEQLESLIEIILRFHLYIFPMNETGYLNEQVLYDHLYDQQNIINTSQAYYLSM